MDENKRKRSESALALIDADDDSDCESHAQKRQRNVQSDQAELMEGHRIMIGDSSEWGNLVDSSPGSKATNKKGNARDVD